MRVDAAVNDNGASSESQETQVSLEERILRHNSGGKSEKLKKVLFIGDVVGASGLRALFTSLKGLKKRTQADWVIANGENVDAGSGISPQDAENLLNCGIDLITSGNHVWRHREIRQLLSRNNRIIRPANYAVDAGSGYAILESADARLAVLNLQGLLFMPAIDSPFKTADKIIKKIKKECDAIIVDFHAEVAGEKEAMAHHLQDHIAALLGTHTHVQTRDERIVAGKVAYISDVGMCGPKESIIGTEKAVAINRARYQYTCKMEIADTPAVIQAVLITIDCADGRGVAIERLSHDTSV